MAQRTVKETINLILFSVVAFEQVVTKYGINCRNALLWLCVPPCVIFGITLIKSKNVRLLFNRKTSKKRCLDARMIGESVAAFLYMVMPSVAWVIAAFLNSKIWVCYRAGYDECGIVRSCSKQEEYEFHIKQRDAKSEAQTLGLLMMTGAVAALGLITWGNHLFCARPVKELELNELVREAARSELERFVMSRAKDKLSEVAKAVDSKVYKYLAFLASCLAKCMVLLL
ncbi:hypothetical protein AC249_AIPGENE5697 [Exaiptasia diaphana]|nr:hypothetical protein AC249_AIPGENE5697 [Exaiptasia diaphana]